VNRDGRAGVVWHTQGSGKSMEMELYVHLAGQRPELRNPTFVVVTDRTELDSQLFAGFARSLLLAEDPVAVTSRAQLRAELAQRTTGGILFTTLQKFGRTRAERESGAEHPLLSERRNIIVTADEAHRSHYDDLDGYARHIRDALPNASFLAFTGTPISFDDRNTQDVFGPVIDTYDLTWAVTDGATVPVYFEPRLIKVGLTRDVTEDDIDRAADEATVGSAPRARRRPGRALGEPIGPAGEVHRHTRQGACRRRHPRDLRQPLRGDHQAPAGLAQRCARPGQDQGGLLRERPGPAADFAARTPVRGNQDDPEPTARP
jgi:type I restriction enzyme R subunit